MDPEPSPFFRSGLAARTAAVLAALAVILGALGAHALKDQLATTQNGAENWRTAAHYHLVHAAVLLVLAWRRPVPRVAWWLIAAGIAGFSGTIYLLCLTPLRWLGPVTPLGGLCLIAGWLALAFHRPARTADSAERKE